MKTKMKQKENKARASQIRRKKPKPMQRVLLGCCPVGLRLTLLPVEERPAEVEWIPEKTAGCEKKKTKTVRTRAAGRQRQDMTRERMLRSGKEKLSRRKKIRPRKVKAWSVLAAQGRGRQTRYRLPA